MMNRQFVWVGMILAMTLWLIGACAEPSQAVTAPLIGDERVEFEPENIGSIPQQLVVILVTPTPEDGVADIDDSNVQQVAQADTGGDNSQLSEQQLIERGEEVYANFCATCHGPNGQGSGSFPALAGNAALTSEEPGLAIQTVLHGRGQMPAFGDQLTNEQVAAVLTYERSSWGNNAPAVQVSQVAQIAGDGQSGQAQQQAQQQTQEQTQPQAQQQAQQGAQDQSGQQQSGQQQPSEQQPSEQTAQQPAGQQGQAQQPAQQATGAQQTGGQQSGQQGTTVSVNPQGGTITLQIQIVLVTPEPSGADQATATPSGAAQSSQGGTDEAQATATPAADQSGGDGTEGASSDSQSSDGGEQASSSGDQASAGSGQQMAVQQLMSQGEQIFSNNCASCHGPQGQGSGSYPALAGSSVATSEDPSQPISIVAQGQGQMPSFGDQFSPEQIASVLTYVRNSWGNNASPVQPSTVAQVTGEQTSQQQNGQQTGQQQTGQQQTDQTQQPDQPVQPSTGVTNTDTQASGSGIHVTQGEAIPIEIVIVVDSAGNVQVQPGTGVTQPATGEQGAAPQAAPAPAATPSATGAMTTTGAAQTGVSDVQADSSQTGATQPGSVQSDQVLINQGAPLYMNNCAACHQPSGQGIEGVYPPLAGNPFVTQQDPQPVVEVVVTGRAGMPHFGPFLTTEQLASIVTYIRNAWSNNASAISPEQFQQIMETFQSPMEVVEH